MLLDRVCVSFADGVIKLLEDSLPPLIHRVILLEQLSLANGPQPLQQKHTHDRSARRHVPSYNSRHAANAATSHLDHGVLRLIHNQNLTVTQELSAHHMQQGLPATMSPNVMMLPWCQRVIMHMCCLWSCRKVE